MRSTEHGGARTPRKGANNMKTIYLCGPISGCSDEECFGWRDDVKRRLQHQYLFCDPTRRDFRGREEKHASEIVIGDCRDIQACDIVLALANRPTWGTAMEIHFAYASARKHTIVVCGQPIVSPWLRFYSDKLAASIEEAVSYLTQLP